MAWKRGNSARNFSATGRPSARSVFYGMPSSSPIPTTPKRRNDSFCFEQSVTMRLGRDTVEYFKSLAVETGVPLHTLINLYLRDCAVSRRKLRMEWTP